MFVIHVINSLAKGGAEKLLVDSLLFYRDAGVHTAVIQLTGDGASTEYMHQLTQNDIKIHTLSQSSVYNPLLILKLKTKIAGLSPDVIHVHLFPSMYWVGLAKILKGFTAPLVFTEHSTQNKRFNKTIFKKLDRTIYGAYDRIIAISPAIRSKLIKWTNLPQKIAIVRNGIDISKFGFAKPYEREWFLNNLGVSSNVVVMMMVARFAYPKDQKTVVKALTYLPEHFHAVFVGDGEQQQEIKSYAASMGLVGRAHFLGFRTDVPSLMKSADFNILSSIYEGMSGVTCEALAAGQPFLGSDVPGVNDVVPDRRFLFNCGSAEHLAEKVLLIHSAPIFRKQLAEEGLAHVDQFKIQTMVTNTISIYKDLMKS